MRVAVDDVALGPPGAGHDAGVVDAAPGCRVESARPYSSTVWAAFCEGVLQYPRLTSLTSGGQHSWTPCNAGTGPTTVPYTDAGNRAHRRSPRFLLDRSPVMVSSQNDSVLDAPGRLDQIQL